MCVECDFILVALENTLVLKPYGLEYARVKAPRLAAYSQVYRGKMRARKCVRACTECMSNCGKRLTLLKPGKGHSSLLFRLFRSFEIKMKSCENTEKPRGHGQIGGACTCSLGRAPLRGGELCVAQSEGPAAVGTEA